MRISRNLINDRYFPINRIEQLFQIGGDFRILEYKEPGHVHIETKDEMRNSAKLAFVYQTVLKVWNKCVKLLFLEHISLSRNRMWLRTIHRFFCKCYSMCDELYFAGSLNIEITRKNFSTSLSRSCTVYILHKIKFPHFGIHLGKCISWLVSGIITKLNWIICTFLLVFLELYSSIDLLWSTG